MTSESVDVTKTEESGSLRAFLSYSHTDRAIAGALKRIFEANGMDVFLAHEDIEPCDIWVGSILDYLNTCHVFIPLLTPEFERSTWTNQEIGYSYARGKLIIPVKITRDPFGFISHIQALTMRPMDQPYPMHPILGHIQYNHAECASILRRLSARVRNYWGS